jgi:hypothetical protein
VIAEAGLGASGAGIFLDEPPLELSVVAIAGTATAAAHLGHLTVWPA